MPLHKGSPVFIPGSPGFFLGLPLPIRTRIRFGASFFSSRTSGSDESGTPPHAVAPAGELLLGEDNSIALAWNLNEACW